MEAKGVGYSRRNGEGSECSFVRLTSPLFLSLSPLLCMYVCILMKVVGWDLAWPESFRALLLQKLDIAIIPTFWTAADGDALGLAVSSLSISHFIDHTDMGWVQHNPDCEALYLDTTVVARAFENECAIVFVNCGGTKQEGMIGRSGVAVPFKGWLGQTKSGEEEMLMVDLKLGSILHVSRERTI